MNCVDKFVYFIKYICMNGPMNGINMVVSRYAIPTGIPCVDGLSTGPSGFGVSQASTTNNENSIFIMENSYLGGFETLETPNIFLYPTILSLGTIWILSCFIFRKICSQSQSSSCFI